jgi:phytoene dehydrogenase-like protein
MAEACRERGVELQTGVEIAEIRAQNGRVHGVTLATGDEIDAPVVVSNADHKRTFLSLVDQRQIDPDYLRGIKSFRMTGTSAKVNLALSDLPEFTCRPGTPSEAHTGTTEIACSLENLEDGWDACKRGRIAERPCSELVFPTARDETLAPTGKHILSASVQYVPYELADGDWDARREELGDRVIDTIRPGTRVRAHEREQVSRGPDPRPDVHHATGDGLGSLPNPHRRPLPLRRGHPSRAWRHGRGGPERRRRNSPRPPLEEGVTS